MLSELDMAALQYAADRAAIENLQARYLFAMDWWDADAYASTFAEDGSLDWLWGVIKGREAIREEVGKMREYFAALEAEDAPLRPARLRHYINNLVLKVDGDRASARAFWFEINNRNPERKPVVEAYGHYDDELIKVDGQWLFQSRRINNECLDERAAGMINPAW